MRISDLDARDRAILSALQANGRLTNAELADRVGLSPSACLRRVRQLEDSGLVAGYAMILDQKACGFPGNAFVFVSLDQQGRQALDAFEAAVEMVPEIVECYLLAGQSDYLIRVVHRDAADLERIHTEIITRLPGVTRVNSTLALRTVKKTTELPLQGGAEVRAVRTR
jgi:Lrp/AsnC family transcriptional regulator, leucine-responsive regulatory protein